MADPAPRARGTGAHLCYSRVMRKQDIEDKICGALPGAVVELRDLTGTEDHWEAVVVSDAFAGRSLIERHRMVFAALAEEMKGPIHALTLKVYTTGERRG